MHNIDKYKLILFYQTSHTDVGCRYELPFVDDHTHVRTFTVRLLVGRSENRIQQAIRAGVSMSFHALYAVGHVDVVLENSTLENE